MEHIELQPIPETDKLVLRNLLHLYLYDLSEYKQTDVNDHGTFEYPRVDQYWYDDACAPFYLRADGRIAGFVLIHRYDLLKHNRCVISEFFVLQKYRRRRVGTEAARLIFSAFPGPWEVSEIPANLPSQMFWRRVIGEFTQGAYHETEIDGRPVQYFDYPPPS